MLLFGPREFEISMGMIIGGKIASSMMLVNHDCVICCSTLQMMQQDGKA